MSMSDNFVILKYQESLACSCCGIDQQATSQKGQPEKKYFMIPDKNTGGHLCPACFFAREWMQYGAQMQGKFVFTDTPQSFISLSFYLKQIASRSSLQKTPNLILSVDKIMNEVLENSNKVVKKYFASIEQEMLKGNPSYISQLAQQITMPPFIVSRMRYIPHSADFQIFTYCNRPSEQLTNFLEATAFHVAMSKSERGFISQAIAWLEEARAAVHI